MKVQFLDLSRSGAGCEEQIMETLWSKCANLKPDYVCLGNHVTIQELLLRKGKEPL